MTLRNISFIAVLALCVTALGLLDAQIKQHNQTATPQLYPEEVLPRGDAL